MTSKKTVLLATAAVGAVIAAVLLQSGLFEISRSRSTAGKAENNEIADDLRVEKSVQPDGVDARTIPAGNRNRDNRIAIYLDADMTINSASGIAIQRGIETALSEVDWKLGSLPVELVVKDHQGNAVRSKKHLQDYLQDMGALVMFSGLHSPPLLAHREFINTHEILVLVPWAAAGPITRYPSRNNWIFRLSVDDTKAGHVIVDYALKKGHRKPALLLEETGWGKSNEMAMKAALQKLGGASPVVTKWFNWNLRDVGAKILLREIIEARADVILLVANTPEGKTFAKAMVSFPPDRRLPICSHWGITGGDFPAVINAEMRKGIDLSFIQTRFSFLSCSDHELGRNVLARASALYPQSVRTASDIKAPAGFVHAYDLTRILITAVEQVGLTNEMHSDRRNVRAALENLERPVEGLLKTYKTPFCMFCEEYPDAHEALGIEDYVMAHYRNDDGIVLETESRK